MTEIISRRKIMRACKSRGWMVQSSALMAMYKYLNYQKEDVLEDVLDELEESNLIGGSSNNNNNNNNTLLTETIWKEVIETTTYNNTDETVIVDKIMKGNGNSGMMEVVNAFESPRLVFDSMRKNFRVEQKQWSMLGTAADKINMMTQRYALVQQRILRHDVFRMKTVTYRSSQPDIAAQQQQHTITPIESLLGKSNSDQVPVVVLGILIQVEESKFYLEDPTGRVQASFNDATAVDDFYVTENSILLVEATFQDEILYVDRIGSPFVEKRQKSLQLLRQQVRHPHFLASSSGSDYTYDNNNSFVVLSDVHLDQPKVLNLLECLFDAYESHKKPKDLPIFCLMGNFSSTSYTPLSQSWEELAMLISKFPFLSQHAHFIFIPGPNDTRSNILPSLPLAQEIIGIKKTMQSYQIEHVHWGSNPCRIYYKGKEIVLFRHDTLSCMLQNQVRVHQKEDMVDRTPHSRMVRTIVDQGHLMPVARAPIYWNFDHALRLYPLPDAVILCGSSAAEEYEKYEDCDAIHPGSFSKTGTYSIYTPFVDESEDDDMSIDSNEPRKRVQFCQVKESD